MRFVVLGVLATLALPAIADRDTPYIAVNSSAYIEAVPDILSLDIGLSASGKDVSTLQKQVDKDTRQVVKAARSQGVDKDDIDSSRISVQPDYTWIDGKRVYRGQVVRRSITLVLRDPGSYGALLTNLSSLNVDQIGEPRPGHSELESLQLAAMEKALSLGLKKAEHIAEELDVDLGGVIRVEELGSARSPMPRMMMAEATNADTAPQIEFGKRRISASVALRFSID
ncbi:MAG: SIMPL domain-containing protein [Pseudomonadota bacterium]